MKTLLATIIGFIKAHTVVSIITAATVVTIGVATPIIVHQVTKPKESESVQTEINSEANDDNLETENDILGTESNITTDTETNTTVDTENTNNTISNNKGSNPTTNNTTSNTSNTDNKNTNQNNIESNTTTSNTNTNKNNTTNNNSNQNNATTNPPVHTHSFSAATCTSPKTCTCGATEGTALNHIFEGVYCKNCRSPLEAISKNSWISLKKQGETYYFACLNFETKEIIDGACCPINEALSNNYFYDYSFTIDNIEYVVIGTNCIGTLETSTETTEKLKVDPYGFGESFIEFERLNKNELMIVKIDDSCSEFQNFEKGTILNIAQLSALD